MAWNNQPTGAARGNYFIRERRFIGETTKASIVDAVAHAAALYALNNGGQGLDKTMIDKLKLAVQFAATRVEGAIDWQNEKVQEAIDNDRRNPPAGGQHHHQQTAAVPQYGQVGNPAAPPWQPQPQAAPQPMQQPQAAAHQQSPDDYASFSSSVNQIASEHGKPPF